MNTLHTALVAAALCMAVPAHADTPWTFANDTRYLAMGDSLTSGYGAMPMTNGYAYLLYEEGAFGALSNTIFANIAIPGATSAQVLAHQVPAAAASGMQPNVITMTVGGNDLFTILDRGADPATVLANFQGNLLAIVHLLCRTQPQARIYVANLYAIRDFPVPVEPVIEAFNQVVSGVVAFHASAPYCYGRVKVADVYAEFTGPQGGLLLVGRNGASFVEAHPSNAGHRAIARAFAAAR